MTTQQMDRGMAVDPYAKNAALNRLVMSTIGRAMEDVDPEPIHPPAFTTEDDNPSSWMRQRKAARTPIQP
jgi:hypothetical protein